MWVSSGSSPPSLEQLHMLSALPSAMASSMRERARRTRGQTKGALVKEAQLVSRTFDALGSRPSPTNGLSLEQTVQLELMVDYGTVTSSIVSGVPSYFGNTFVLSAFSGGSSLTTVFDQYRIDQLEVWIETTVPNNVNAFPTLISAVDLDDANTPTSVGQVSDHLGALQTNGPAGHYHKWKPHVALAAYSGAFTSYCNTPSQWIDSASPNVQHYGLKYALVSNSTAGIQYRVTCRAVVSFRAPSIN